MKQFSFWIALWIVGANALENLHIVKLKNNNGHKNDNGTITGNKNPIVFFSWYDYFLYKNKV